jgi:hypothetical protein
MMVTPVHYPTLSATAFKLYARLSALLTQIAHPTGHALELLELALMMESVSSIIAAGTQTAAPIYAQQTTVLAIAVILLIAIHVIVVRTRTVVLNKHVSQATAVYRTVYATLTAIAAQKVQIRNVYKA